MFGGGGKRKNGISFTAFQFWMRSVHTYSSLSAAVRCLCCALADSGLCFDSDVQSSNHRDPINMKGIDTIRQLVASSTITPWHSRTTAEWRGEMVESALNRIRFGFWVCLCAVIESSYIRYEQSCKRKKRKNVHCKSLRGHEVEGKR